MKKIMTFLLVFVLSICFVGNVFAADSTNSNVQIKQVSVEKGKQIQKAIEILNKYVTRLNDGTFQLTVPKNVRSQIADDVFAQIVSGMNQINGRVLKGTLVTTPNLTVYDPKDTRFTLQDGVNKIVYYWWGDQLWVDHAGCVALENAQNTVAAGCALLSLVPGVGDFATAYGGWMWLNASIVADNDAGRGVVESFSAGVEFWIGGQ